jgi:ribosomal RNA-processing protein 8
MDDDDWTKAGTLGLEIDGEKKVAEVVATVEATVKAVKKVVELKKPGVDADGLTRKQRKSIRSRERRKRKFDENTSTMIGEKKDDGVTVKKADSKKNKSSNKKSSKPEVAKPEVPKTESSEAKISKSDSSVDVNSNSTEKPVESAEATETLVKEENKSALKAALNPDKMAKINPEWTPNATLEARKQRQVANGRKERQKARKIAAKAEADKLKAEEEAKNPKPDKKKKEDKKNGKSIELETPKNPEDDYMEFYKSQDSSVPSTNTKKKENSEFFEDNPEPTAEELAAVIDEKLPEKSLNLIKLEGARFRVLNQKLYTGDSVSAQEMFDKDPKLAEIYHTGYTEQVKRWPANPVFSMIEFIKKRPGKEVNVADMGCGDAKIARGLEWSKRIKVHSFDLYAMNDKVTVADIANVPLEPETMDVAVFCLSLMGTNLHEFLLEANRILKKDGMLKIAEVRSRFGAKETIGLKKFIRGVQALGFYFNKKNSENSLALDHKNSPNTHFVLMEFKKIKSVDARSCKEESVKNLLKLEACIYKKR